MQNYKTFAIVEHISPSYYAIMMPTMRILCHFFCPAPPVCLIASNSSSPGWFLSEKKDMEFGKISEDELANAAFMLPPDPASTVSYLRDHNGEFETRIYVGCSKWGQKEWVGKVYPDSAKEAEFLNHYIERYDALELDSTFYNIQRKNVQKLIEAARGKDFKYCPKFSRRISHAKDFNEVKDLTDYYIALMKEFGDNLGVCILQFPEYFAIKRLHDLEQLLGGFPEDFPVTIELRNKGWFYEPDHPVFDLLRRYKAGAAIADTAGRRDVLHMQITSPDLVIRYVGNNLHPSDFSRMSGWAERINDWLQYRALRSVYFFVHNDDESCSPAMASYMADKIKEICGVAVKAPAVKELKG